MNTIHVARAPNGTYTVSRGETLLVSGLSEAEADRFKIALAAGTVRERGS